MVLGSFCLPAFVSSKYRVVKTQMELISSNPNVITRERVFFIIYRDDFENELRQTNVFDTKHVSSKKIQANNKCKNGLENFNKLMADSKWIIERN